MRDANPKINSKKGDRSGWLINNKLYGSRAMRSKFGTTKIEVIKKRLNRRRKKKIYKFFYKGNI